MSNWRDSIPVRRATGPGPLSQGTVHVWFLDRAGPPDRSWIEVLDDQERRRAESFLTQDQRDAFAAAHALVRTALSAYGRSAPADWRFAISPEGHPSVLGVPELSFSLTHAGPWAAVAIGVGQAVGLDLEPVRPERDPLPLARRFFATSEAEWLLGLPADERPAGFAALWTMKEAVLKARGCGLTEPLRSVEVEVDPSGRPGAVRAPGGPWALRSWSPEPGWYAALAVPGRGTVSVVTVLARPLESPVPAPELGPELSPA